MTRVEPPRRAGDPRESDVAQAERLFALAERDGAVRLPDLLAVDLCALGVGGQALVDGPVLATWAGLDADARARLAVQALSGLALRGLLDPPDEQAASDTAETVSLRLRAPLSMILAARTRPTLLAVCTVPGQQQYAEPRLYGVGDAASPVRALVCEQATRDRVEFGTGERVELTDQQAVERAGELNQVFRFALFSAHRAGRVLASWAAAPVAAPNGQDPGSPPARVVEVYRNTEVTGLVRDRVQVQAGGGTMAVEVTRADGARQAAAHQDQDGLAALLAGMVEIGG